MNPSTSSSQRSVYFRRIALIFIAGFAFVFLLLVLLGPKIRAHMQAVAILNQLHGSPVPRLFAPVASMPVAVTLLTLPSSAGPVAARLYTPIRSPNAPGLVLIPGIHTAGMDEPRLVAFARAMSACGLRVLTPELPGSSDYRIQPDDIQAIGDSVLWLQHATGRKVGLMALSFSGGLVLMAAAQPRYANSVSFVFSVGAHDDLYRVATFFTTGADPLPSGDIERATPNPYGPMVLEYEHLEDFVSPADATAIRPVFRARLQENYSLEAAALPRLTPAQKAQYRSLLDTPHQASPLFASDKIHADDMAAVSPHGHLAGLRAPVYLLHGRRDTLIPFAEAEWLAQDLPPGTLAQLLISPLVAHVSTTTTSPGFWDEWQLLHLLAQVMERATHA